MQRADHSEADAGRLSALAWPMGPALLVSMALACSAGCSSKPTQRASLEYHSQVIDPVASPFAGSESWGPATRAALSSVPTDR